MFEDTDHSLTLVKSPILSEVFPKHTKNTTLHIFLYPFPVSFFPLSIYLILYILLIYLAIISFPQ